MKFMNPGKRFAIGILSVAMVILLAHANSNNGPVSASDQQVQAIDLIGKQEQQKVDLFTGSFGYSVPIKCAPARNSSEPSLALTYSSSGDNGWCGMGWTLTIGYIERNTRDGFPIRYSSGTPADPLTQYDDSKGFLLNLSGRDAKLFAVATNGAVVEYRAEVDTDFLRCFCDTNNNTWTIYDKSGTAYYFGEAAGSREVNSKTGWSGYSATFRWALDQVVTATGDLTTIAYTNYTSPYTSLPEKTLYPLQIAYNGHTSNNTYSATSPGANTITFATELRPNDWHFSYRTGFRMESDRRLTNILCSAGSQKVWSYNLKYGTSPATDRSLLTNVVLYGFDANNNASALLTNTFTYQANTNGVTFGSAILWSNLDFNTPGYTSGSYEPEVAQVNQSYGFSWTVADLVDMDGDGLPDRVCFDETGSLNRYRIQKNLGLQANGYGLFAQTNSFGPTSTGSGSASDSNLMPNGQNYGALNTPYGRIRDINADGLPDRLMDYWKPFNSNPTTPYYTNFSVMLNNGTGFSSSALLPVTTLINYSDVNGAYLTYECVEGGGTVNYGSYSINVGVGLFDINGDGYPDREMTTFAPYEAMTNLYVQVNSGTNFTQLRRFPYKSQNSLGADYHTVSQFAGIETPDSHFMDLNGDGLPDHIMWPFDPNQAYGEHTHPVTYFALEYNDGYSFESTNSSTGSPGAFDQWPGVVNPVTSTIIYNSTTFYGDAIWDLPFVGLYDVNGDGLPDRLMIDPATWGNSNTGWLVYLNNGHGFDTTARKISGINNQGHVNLTSDSPWWSIQGTGNQSPESGNEITTLIDINGDGLLDRVMAVYYSSFQNPTAHYFLVQLNQGPSPDLLTNINNGIGGNIGVSYKSSTAYDNRVDTSNPNSVSHMPYPRQVTASVTESDGINSPQTTTYGYSGGFYDGSRREFQGFAVVTNTDPTLRYTVTYFHTGGGRNYSALGEYQDTNSTTGAGNFAKAGMVYRVETYGNDNKLYNVQVSQVDQASLGNGRYFPFVTQSFNCDYPGNGTPKVTATDFAYDLSNGNLTNKIEYGLVTGFNPSSVGSFSFTDADSTDNRIHNTHYTAIDTYILDHPDKVALDDVNNNVIHETDYSYNSGGTLAMKLNRISDSYFATNSYANYNSYGLVGLTTDPVGVQTEITYDSTHTFPATSTVGGTFTTSTTYDPGSGQLAVSTDISGLTTSNSFDSFHRLTEIDQIPIGGGSAIWVQKISYPTTLKPIANGVATNYVDVLANDGMGGEESRTYIDGFERAIQTRTQAENGSFRVVSTAYDGRGNAFLTTWPTYVSGAGYTKPATSGLTASWTGFDAAGRMATNRPVNVTFTSGGAFNSANANAGDGTQSPMAARTWSYVNGSDPWWVICTDEDSKVRKYQLDAFGRTNEIQEVNGSSTYTTTLNYDLADNLTNIVNANNENIYWAYNDMGGLVAMADPYLGQWTYQRDYANRLRVQTDARGDVIKVHYTDPTTGFQDPLGRVMWKEIYSSNYVTHALTLYSTVTNIYDSGDSGYAVYPGQLFEVIDKHGWEKTGYDSRERTIKNTRFLNINSNAYTTSYTLDDGGNITSIAYPNSGPTITNAYWHGGSIHQVSLNGGSVDYYTAAATAFDEFDHVTNFVYGNSLITTRSYYSKSKRLETISAGSVFTRTYEYTAGDDVAFINGTGITNVSVAYDNLHRIKTYTGLTGSYSYDPTGNISNNIEGGGSQYAYASPRIQAVRTAFGYTNLYDLCGNMVVRHGGLTNSQALTYDPENQLLAIAQAGVFSDEFGYAADGTRLWKRIDQNPTNVQVWIGNIYEEKGGKKLFHVFAGSQQVCTFEAGSPLDGGSDTNKVGYYYCEDSLNTSSALSDSDHNQIEVNVYYPFGRTQTATPQASFQVSRRFTGQVFDAESGLYYYGARYYDPELGRFIQPDSIISDLSNPQSYNRYAYALNNPLHYTDPDGHAPSDWANSMQPAIDTYYNGYIHNPSHTSTIALFFAYMGQSTASGYNDMLRFGTGMEKGTLEGVAQDLGRGGGIILTVAGPADAAATRMAPKTAPALDVSSVSDTSPVKPGDTGTYGELKTRKSANGETEPLDMDHQPSFAAQVKAKEAQLGRPLTKEELKKLKENTPAVASPRPIHQQTSPTYGGRNTKAQINRDASNLEAARARDRAAFDKAMKKR